MQLEFVESNVSINANVNAENRSHAPTATDTALSKEEPTDERENQTGPLSVTIPPSEFILGIADLTGELMRNAINALGAGNMEVMQLFRSHQTLHITTFHTWNLKMAMMLYAFPW